MNIGEYCPSSELYCTSVQVQYDTLQGTIFTNIHAITLSLFSNKFFAFLKYYLPAEM